MLSAPPFGAHRRAAEAVVWVARGGIVRGPAGEEWGEGDGVGEGGHPQLPQLVLHVLVPHLVWPAAGRETTPRPPKTHTHRPHTGPFCARSLSLFPRPRHGNVKRGGAGGQAP